MTHPNRNFIASLTAIARLLAHGAFDAALPEAWQRDTIISLLETSIIRLSGDSPDYNPANAQIILDYMERGEWGELLARAGELV